MSDLDQIDRAFSHLTDDLAGRSIPPGARGAITRSRRRTAARVGVAAVAIATLVGGTALLASGSDRDVQVASENRAMPTARVLDAQSLGDATDGWLSGWADAAEMREPALLSSCVSEKLAENLPEPAGAGQYIASTPDGASSFTMLADLGAATAADAWETTLLTGLRGCADAVSDVSYDGGAHAWHGRATRPQGGGELWVSRLDDRLAVSVVAPVATEAGNSVVRQYADALIAALAADESFGQLGEGPSGPDAEATPGTGQLDQASVSSALQPWLEQGAADPAAPACLPERWADQETSETGGADSTGWWHSERTFSGAQSVMAGMRIGQALDACTETAYTSRLLGDLAPSVDLTVWTSSATHAHTTVWMAVTPERTLVASATSTVAPLDQQTADVVAQMIADQLAR